MIRMWPPPSRPLRTDCKPVLMPLIVIAATRDHDRSLRPVPTLGRTAIQSARWELGRAGLPAIRPPSKERQGGSSRRVQNLTSSADLIAADLIAETGEGW